jgi:hypothetical protein
MENRWMPHVGRAQRLRGLKQNWALFEKVCKRGGDYAVATRDRLLDSVVDDPSPENAAMNIVLGSYLAVRETRKGAVTGENWIKALNEAMNHWEKLADDSKAQAAADGAVL